MPVENIHSLLKDRFGFESFRPMQEDIIRHTLQGNDALVIMPTGGGKSVCYQLPAIVLDGLTLVISPLISLMNDQVRSLKARNIEAAAWHSGTSTSDAKHLMHQLQSGALKILYVSPERALSEKFLELLTHHRVSLIAIDEAHCVSVWGNDFRPEYARLPELTKKYAGIPVLALTATADKATQQDICERLALRHPEIFLSGFERTNIFLSARAGTGRLDHIRDFILQREGQPGIIYCLARKTAESLAATLRNWGYAAEPYHAEIDMATRLRVQNDFQADRIGIVCATIAFGMGIDKPNIRWIIHYNLPKNIESYYQETGRSGRDGEPAEALLFYSFRDIAVYKDFITSSDADPTFKRIQEEKLERIWEYSQSTTCRTNLILHYFGEYRTEGCGHCDRCNLPVEGFDGTQIAQMALSACIRCDQQVGMNLLIDVLRGSARKEVYERNLHTVKTYGAGRAWSFAEWAGYITQMINQGLLEIDYTRHSILRTTPLSDEVLFKGKNVTLHKQVDDEELRAPRQTRGSKFYEELLGTLEDLCDGLGRKENVPPYSILTKETIREIAAVRPITRDKLAAVKGVGDHKAKKYGSDILEAIRNYMLDQKLLKKPKGMTYAETLRLFRQDMSLEEIAAQRKMSPGTIASHLARLYQQGEEINLEQFLRPGDIVLARQAWRASGYSDQSAKVKEQLGDSLDYGRLHFALAILRREKMIQQKSE